MKLRLTAPALVLLAVAAAAEAQPVTRAEPMRARPALYTCARDVVFPKRMLYGGRGVERHETAAARALREFLVANPNLPQQDWYFLSMRRTYVQYGHGWPTRSLYAHFVRADGGWMPAEHGRCTPQRVIRGFSVMRWSIASDVGPATRRLRISIHAGGCLRRHSDFRRVEVSYGARSVNLLVLMRSVPRGAICTADIRFLRRAILLPKPVGNRTLRDARTWFPSRVSRARFP